MSAVGTVGWVLSDGSNPFFLAVHHSRVSANGGLGYEET